MESCIPADLVSGEVSESKVHPVCNDESEDQARQFKCDKLAARTWFAGLALPHWDCRSIDADAQASYNAAYDHL
jgi:hypothetical protein